MEIEMKNKIATNLKKEVMKITHEKDKLEL